MTGRRVAVVTGAARGIGAAVVRRLAGDGWAVVAVDRCAEDPGVPYPLASEEQLAALAGNFPDVRAVLADVRDAGAVTGAIKLAEREFGRLDAAVAAAAVILGGGPAWELSDTDWRTLLDVDVTGVLNLARAAIPALLRSPQPRHGRFVALASAAAHHGLWRLGGYCTAKHACSAWSAPWRGAIRDRTVAPLIPRLASARGARWQQVPLPGRRAG
jgi:SDR family mycofactocin-dependent oxidoreductase